MTENDPCRLLCDGVYAGLLFIAALTLKPERSVNQRKQRVVLADSDICAGVDVCPALSVKDITGLDKLTVRALGAEALSMAVTAVAGGTHSLLMSEELKIHVEHVNFLRSLNLILT